MSDFDGIPETKVNVEMPPVVTPTHPPMKLSTREGTAPLSEAERADMAEAISDIFVKHNRAVNMDAYDKHSKTFSYYWCTFKHWLDDHNPFGGYRMIKDTEEYINMPWRQRSVFLFWYLDPLLTGDGTVQGMFGRKAEREKMEKWLKRHHFIQFYLRKWGFTSRCRLSRFYDWCDNTMFPRQKWLKKQIPNGWCDKVHLIQLINFAMVVDFVEGEDAINVTDWEGSSEQASQFEKELKDCYDYIKVRRPKLEEAHSNSYPDEDKMTGDYYVDYATHNQIEIALDKEDTKYLTWIVVNREFFWT